MNKYHRKTIGLTLIELLITLLILAILIPMAVAAYGQLFSQQALVQKTEQLYRYLHLAKSHAIMHNKKVYVHFCPAANNQAWDIVMTEHAVCHCHASDACLLNTIRPSEKLSDGVILLIAAADITFNGKQASYSPMRFSVNPGSVTLTDDSGVKLKVIQSAMRLRVCAPEQAQLGYDKC